MKDSRAYLGPLLIERSGDVEKDPGPKDKLRVSFYCYI